MSAPERSERYSRRVMTMLLVSALFVIISGSALIYFTTYVPYQNRLQTTAIAQYHLSSTSHTQATQSAYGYATAQAQVAITATAIASLQSEFNRITGLTPTLNDMLHSPDTANWETGIGCAFSGNAYILTETHKGTVISCIAQNTDYRNFVYQVDMKIVHGDDGGMTFRTNPNSSQFYLFRVGLNGIYSLYYYPDGTGKTAQKLESGFSALILTGINQENSLAVLAHDDSISLFINKVYVTGTINSALATGRIGLIAEDTTQATEILYTQARVWQL